MQKFTLLIVLLVALVGCASSSHHDEKVKLIQEPDALAQLQTVAVVAVERMRDIQAALQAERQKMDKEAQLQEMFNATYVPEGFESIASVKTSNWPDVICAQMAELAGYDSPVHLGNRPKAPMLISINKHNVPLWEMVQELGLKTGQGFTMEIHENSKLVRCIYNTAKPGA